MLRKQSIRTQLTFTFNKKKWKPNDQKFRNYKHFRTSYTSPFWLYQCFLWVFSDQDLSMWKRKWHFFYNFSPLQGCGRQVGTSSRSAGAEHQVWVKQLVAESPPMAELRSLQDTQRHRAHSHLHAAPASPLIWSFLSFRQTIQSVVFPSLFLYEIQPETAA